MQFSFVIALMTKDPILRARGLDGAASFSKISQEIQNNFFLEFLEKFEKTNFCILTSFFTFLEVFPQIFPNSAHF
jgi:hypothetical protein